MSQSRRDFIKFVVAGSVASGCPIDAALFAEPAAKNPSPSWKVSTTPCATNFVTATPSPSLQPHAMPKLSS